MYLYQKIILFFIAFILITWGGFFAYSKVFKVEVDSLGNAFIENFSRNEQASDEAKPVDVSRDSQLAQEPVSKNVELQKPVAKKLYNRIDAVNGMVIDFNLNQLIPPLFFKVSDNVYEKLSPSYLLKLEESELMDVRKSLDEFGVFILEDGSYKVQKGKVN